MPTKKLRQEPQPGRSFFTIVLLCVFDNTVSLSAEVVEHQVLSRNAEVVEHLPVSYTHLSYSREMPVNASAMENIVMKETFSWKNTAMMMATSTG